MKKYISLLFVVIIIVSSFTVFAAADDKPTFDADARHVLLVNLDTDTVAYEHDAYSKDYPASLTKIMTAIVALENTRDLDAMTVTAKDEHFKEFAGVPISTANIKSGETFSMRELLYALMLNSACEAANIIADHVGGSVDAFIGMMNRKAAEIGAVNTQFANPHGLFDEQNYSTAYDMYLITAYALNIPDFRTISFAKTYTIRASATRTEKRLVHTNRMLFENDANFGKYYLPQVKGIKTGTLSQAGKCLITYAEHNGCRYVCVVMGGKNSDNASRYKATYNVYRWAFDNRKLATVADETETVAQLPVSFSKDDEVVALRPAKTITALVPANTESAHIQLIPHLPESVEAPVTRGDVLGTATVMVQGEEVATVDLVAAQDVARLAPVLSAVRYEVITPLLVVFILLLLVMLVRLRKKKKCKRRRSRK